MSSPTFDFHEYRETWRIRIDRELECMVPRLEPLPLWEAMRYSVLGEGKRLRPLLGIAAMEALGGDPEPHLPAFCVIELLHSLSLVCDDLPAMDNDAMRRGRPSCHAAHGEANAILAMDGLFALCFHALSRLDPALVGTEVRMALVDELAETSMKMLRGQALDLYSTGKPADPETLDRLHHWKTASLITCCVRFGAILAGHRPPPAALDTYADALGLAYQIADDILDATQDSETLGKTAGKDAAAGKLTYVTSLGLAGAEAKLAETLAAADAALQGYGERAAALKAIAELVGVRTRRVPQATSLSAEDRAARDAAMRDVEADLALIEQDYHGVIARLDGSRERFAGAALVRQSLERHWHGPLRHALVAKGKFLRPLFSYWFFRSHVAPVAPLLVGEGEASARELLGHMRGLGTALEVTHTASLVLDDIVDDSAERRLEPTLHRRYGLPVGLNTGMALAFLGFECLGDSPVKQLALEFVLDSYAGQALDLGHGSPAFVREAFAATPAERWALYQETARLKATKPLAFSVLGLAELVAIPDDERERIAAALDLLGLAHQALNDIREFSPAFNGGKGPADLDAGPNNLVCLRLLERLSPPELAEAESASLEGRFSAYASAHPALPAAWAAAIVEARAWLAASEAGLAACCPRVDGKAYLHAVFHSILWEPLGYLEGSPPVARQALTT